MKWAKVSCSAAAMWLLVSSNAMADLPTKQSNIGDSMSQGFSANGFLGDHPRLSWVQGTDVSVGSIFERYLILNPKFKEEPESVTGAELVGLSDNFAAQASRVCAQKIVPQRVSVLLGANDVCNRDRSSSSDAAANMYSTSTMINALMAGLDQLAACLPDSAIVHVMSMPRVDFLFEAGTAKSWWCNYVVWPVASICPIVTAESDPRRRAQVGARIDDYNEAFRAQLEADDTGANGKNPRGLRFVTDWRGSVAQGFQSTSMGTYVFGPDDINGTDCFHPNQAAQSKIACTAWATNPDGSGTVAKCLQ